MSGRPGIRLQSPHSLFTRINNTLTFYQQKSTARKEGGKDRQTDQKTERDRGRQVCTHTHTHGDRDEREGEGERKRMNMKILLDMVNYACNPSTGEVETGGFRVLRLAWATG